MRKFADFDTKNAFSFCSEAPSFSREGAVIFDQRRETFCFSGCLPR